MSKANVVCFMTASGYFRNQRTLRLVSAITKAGLPAEYGFLAPSILWAHATENQTDGDYAGYTASEFEQIFRMNSVTWSTDAIAKVVAAVRETGFIEPDGKLHSWDRLNGRIVHHAEIVAAKKRAAQEKWARDQARKQLAHDRAVKANETRRKEKEQGQDPAPAGRDDHPARDIASAPDTSSVALSTGQRKSSPPPLFRQIESVEILISNEQARLAKLPKNSRLLSDEEARKVSALRAPVLDKLAALTKRRDELHRQQAAGDVA